MEYLRGRSLGHHHLITRAFYLSYDRADEVASQHAHDDAPTFAPLGWPVKAHGGTRLCRGPSSKEGKSIGDRLTDALLAGESRYYRPAAVFHPHLQIGHAYVDPRHATSQKCRSALRRRSQVPGHTN
jgi:hypothetical protein